MNGRKLVKLSGSAALIGLFATAVQATYLGVITSFVCSLATSIRIIGNSLAVVMFVYGAAKYMYTSDDPGGRKQAMGICIAAIVAFLIIMMAGTVINQIGAQVAASSSSLAGLTNPCH